MISDPGLDREEGFRMHRVLAFGRDGLSIMDCRRVMINVVQKKRPGRLLAAIGYGFDREAEDAGPYLDPLSEQCPYADAPGGGGGVGRRELCGPARAAL